MVEVDAVAPPDSVGGSWNEVAKPISISLGHWLIHLEDISESIIGIEHKLIGITNQPIEINTLIHKGTLVMHIRSRINTQILKGDNPHMIATTDHGPIPLPLHRRIGTLNRIMPHPRQHRHIDPTDPIIRKHRIGQRPIRIEDHILPGATPRQIVPCDVVQG